MTRTSLHILAFSLIFSAGMYLVGCTFSGGPGCDISSFEGCFESDDFGQSVIQLDTRCRSLAGTLTIGQLNDPDLQVYALEGDTIEPGGAGTVGLAEFTGLLVSPGASRSVRINALLSPGDSLRLILEDEGILGPMVRCVSQE